MARSNRTLPVNKEFRQSSDGDKDNGSNDTPEMPAYTGRYLVLMPEDNLSSNIQVLEQSAGLHVARASEYEETQLDTDTLDGADAVVFDTLGVAVVSAPPDQISFIAEAADQGAMVVEPERYVEFFEAPELTPYLLGYRDAVNDLVERTLRDSNTQTDVEEVNGASWNESLYTWGLQATRINQSPLTGNGIRVAILDTGMDLTHPDFAGRQIVTASFIANQNVQDGHGHGTHCIGTACGTQTPSTNPRYGIAYEATIYAGKVLNNRGRGTDASILAGIEWAVQNQCAVISMSLGAPVQANQPISRVFEIAAQRVLNAGSLIVAAAGNDSTRPNPPQAVSHPANCPSIMAVGAIDAQMAIASFSNSSLNCTGGQVDIVGPGVAVYSSWPQPRLYRTISGTSMATPHVAGIAALFAELFPNARGRALAQLLLQNACRLPLSSNDVGAGLVQAPRG
jgi:subtilisin family serine protease